MVAVCKAIQKQLKIIGRERRRSLIEAALASKHGLKSIAELGSRRRRNLTASVKNTFGETIYDRQAIANVFADFYSDLYRCRDSGSPLQAHDSGRTCSPFDEVELNTELKNLKSGKCPDTAGIVAEMLKVESVLLRRAILSLFNGVLFSGLTPSSWRQSALMVLFKDGDAQLPNN